MSDTITETLIKNGRFYRRDITEQDLGSQELALSRLAENQSMFFKNMLMIGGQKAHALISKNRVVLITSMTKIPFTTWWSVSHRDENELMPCWTQQRGSIRIEDNFTIPENWGTGYFVQSFDAVGGASFAGGKCYLFVYKNGELFKMPYPNLYDDGKICMGREWERQTNESNGQGHDIASIFMQSILSFQSTQMNGDLTNDYTPIAFRRNEDGWIIVNNSESFMRSCSNALMAGFAP